MATFYSQGTEGYTDYPTLAEEKAINPFLRCQEPAVVAAALRQGATAREPVAVFAAIRGWRNNF